MNWTEAANSGYADPLMEHTLTLQPQPPGLVFRYSRAVGRESAVSTVRRFMASIE
jgi:hypothetical protein